MLSYKQQFKREYFILNNVSKFNCLRFYHKMFLQDLLFGNNIFFFLIEYKKKKSLIFLILVICWGLANIFTLKTT